MTSSASPRPAFDLIRGIATVDGALSLTVDETWLQGRSVYGGVQLAFALSAVRRAVGGDLPIRSFHATFLAPVVHGEPLLATARVLRAGRSVSQVQAQLRQGDQLCFECTAILGVARAMNPYSNEVESSTASPEESLKLNFTPGLTPNFIQHYDLRWARGKPPFSGAENPTATIFARPRAVAARYCEAEFLAITDAIPPPVISLMRTPAPASTMNCAVELIRPEAIYGTRQWLRFEARLHDAHSGYAWQTARIHGESGTLLAVAHQSVAVFG